jgi:hypothetical protein
MKRTAGDLGFVLFPRGCEPLYKYVAFHTSFRTGGSSSPDGHWVAYDSDETGRDFSLRCPPIKSRSHLSSSSRTSKRN